MAAADFHSITSADVCDVVLMVGFQVLMALDAIPHEPTVEPPAFLRRAIARLVRAFAPERIVLFGSHAKGVAQPGSEANTTWPKTFSPRTRSGAACFGSGRARRGPFVGRAPCSFRQHLVCGASGLDREGAYRMIALSRKTVGKWV